MGMAGVSSAIIEFLILTSALLFILGLLSSFVLRVLKIQGKPKLWIYALLLIIPLAYPIQTLLPGPIKVSVPQKTWQLLDFHLSETTTGEKTALNNASFPPGNTAVTYQTEGRETAFNGKEAINSNSSNRLIKTVSEYPINWKLMATLVWLMASIFFLIRLAALVYITNRFSKFLDPVTNPRVLKLLRKCTADTGLHRMPRLLTVDQLSAPMAMGFFKPRIIIPKRLLKPEFREGLRFTLLHELKHVHQRHNWWLLFESVIGAAYFFHPVILWAKKRIREEMEVICDSHVVHVTNKSVSYADFLLHEIWRQKCESAPVLALPFISGRKTTTKRVRSILKKTRPSLFARIRGVFALCFIFLSFISLLLCNVAPSAQGSNQPSDDIAPVITGTQDTASFHTGTDKMEKENPKPSKHAGKFHEAGFSSVRLAGQPYHENTAAFWQATASGIRADSLKSEAPAMLKEHPGHESPAERKRPAILGDETGIPATISTEKQSVPDRIRPAPEPDLKKDTEDIIVLGENTTHVTSGSDLTAVSELKKTELKTGKDVYYIRQGTSHHMQGRYDNAIDDYSKAIEINAKSAVAYNNRGSAYCMKGQTGRALSDYDKAIEIMPGFIAAYANRGYALLKRGRYIQAVSDLSKAIELNPANADTYYIRGSAYYGAGRFGRAISDFNKAIGLNPGYIARMPEGVTPAREIGDIDYASDATESLKWHHGSLPSQYWDAVRTRNADSSALKLYQIRKEGL